jgi:hypothetical protein
MVKSWHTEYTDDDAFEEDELVPESGETPKSDMVRLGGGVALTRAVKEMLDAIIAERHPGRQRAVSRVLEELIREEYARIQAQKDKG